MKSYCDTIRGSLVAKSCLTLAILWTVACQAPLSMGFSRKEYQSGLSFPSPENLPDSGIETGLLHCRQILYQLSYEGSPCIPFSSVQFSCSVMSDSLQLHELQHARPPCPSPTPGVHTNPCLSSR